MNERKRHEHIQTAVQWLVDLFDTREIEGFSHEGQTFVQRAEGLVLHAVDQLEDELDEFRNSDSAGEK